MKGFESVIQGYAEGGSVSSNPFEAYYRGSLANPFAGLLNLPARPQYTPRATAATTSPLRGYMDIYGNLAAIREEQARRRAAATPAPQEDQPSQGSEPTPGPTIPTPQPETLPPREIETGTPLEPDLPSPFETPPPDLSIEYPAEAMPMPDTGTPQPVAPGPVELGLPGFDEAQPVIPPGLGFDSIPAPDLPQSVTREDLPPPEANLPLNYEEATASIPVAPEVVVENPLEQVLESYTPSPVTVELPPREIETPIQDYSPPQVEEAPTNPLADSMLPGEPEVIETTPPRGMRFSSLVSFPTAPVESAEQAPAETADLGISPREIETAIEDYDLPPAFDDVAAMPIFDPDAVEVGPMPAEIEAIAPPSEVVETAQTQQDEELGATPLQDIAVDGTIPDTIQETPAYNLADVLESYSDDAYATPPEIEAVAGVPEAEDVAAIPETSPVYDLSNALDLIDNPPTITEVSPQLETAMEDYSLPTAVEDVATAPSLQDISVDGTLPQDSTDYAEVISDEAPVLTLADVLKSDETYAAPTAVEEVASAPAMEDATADENQEEATQDSAPSFAEEAATEPLMQDIAVDGTLPEATQEAPTYNLADVLESYSDDAYATPPEVTEVAQAPETVDVDAVLGDTDSEVMSGAAKDESAKAPEKSTLADLAKAVFSGIGTTSPLGLANMLGGMAATQALKGEEEAPMSLTQLALEKVAPSRPTLFELSPAAKQEMVDRGNTAGAAMAEAVSRGDISKDAAATALTNDINLVGSLGHALAALEAGTQTMKGTEDTGLALSPEDSSDVQSAESDTGTAPSTDVGPPSGFDAGFGSGFDFGGYDGGYDGGGSDSDSGGGSESDGGGGGGESDGGGGGSESDGGGWAKGGYIPGDSGGMDDDVPALIDGKEPAKLSSGEFVFDAATVAALGDGNNEAGAKKLNMLREAIRKKAYGHKKQPPKNFSVGDLVRLYDRMR